MRVTVLLLLTSWTLLDWHAASTNACEWNWFGFSCQYKCRCKSISCSPQGDCPGGVACEEGWFGPACQYADLAYRANTSQPKTTDGDDSSCLTRPGLDNVAIALNTSSHFTWLRLLLSNPDFLYNLTVRFRRDASLSCTNTRTVRVDNTTLDIHCDLNQTVKHVILSGDGVQHLCSVYISGGRNVALRQHSIQSSVYSERTAYTNNMNMSFGATKAVDGNRGARLYEDNTCMHTRPDVPDPSLNVTFSRLQYITRYVLFNRNSNVERLQHFELRSFNNDSGPPVLDYKDNSSRGQLVYTVTPESVATPIRLVNIRADNWEKILTVCELEVYGDSACETGKYGRECEHTCHCAGDQSCFVSTGACPSGCTAGFLGQDCSTRCEQGRYGPGCQLSCSQFCVRGNDTWVHFCANTDGACLHGCLTGYQGSTCSQELSSKDNMDVVIVVATVGGGGGALLLVVLAVVFCRRCETTKRETHGDNISLSRDDRSEVHRTLSDDEYEIPVASTTVTQRVTQRGSHGKIESEDIVGYESVAHTYDGSFANTYEEIDDNLASPYKAVVDDSPEYANTL